MIAGLSGQQSPWPRGVPGAGVNKDAVSPKGNDVGKLENLVIAAHALSGAYRGRLEQTIAADVRFMTLAELRQRPLRALPGYLRSLRIGALYIALEANAERAYLPMLLVLSLFAGAGSVNLLEPDAGPRRVSPLERLRALVSLLGACVVGQGALLLSRWELALLCSRRRSAVGALSTDPVLYLMPGPMAGVKAGGAVAHVTGVVNALVRAGKAVDFVSCTSLGLTGSGMTVHEMQPLETLALPSETNLYGHNRRFVRQVLSRFNRGRAGFVYSRMTLGNYAGVMVSRALGLPLVLEYNGSEVWISRTWGTPLRYEKLASAAEEACLRHAHLVVTVSAALRGQLIEKGVPEDRIVCHPNGVDPEIFDPNLFPAAATSAEKSSLGIPADSLVLSFVGTFAHWHGAEVFAQAIRNLTDGGEDWLKRHRLRFVFVGDGAMRPKAEEILDTPACRKIVHFTGLVPQEKAPLYMAVADVLVSPHVPNTDGSRFFGSPTKLFEYMAMGRPIIASDLEQVGQILEGNPLIGDLSAGSVSTGSKDCAVLSEPGNADDLALAIKWVVENEHWRQSAGPRARELVLSRYTWDRHVAAILRALT